jgi:hypothetical protein
VGSSSCRSKIQIKKLLIYTYCQEKTKLGKRKRYWKYSQNAKNETKRNRNLKGGAFQIEIDG